MADVITDREKFKQGWTGGLPETPCGAGSKMSNTLEQRKWIPKLVSEYEIESIADIGAGDLNWVQHVTWPHSVDYKAYDLVPRHEDVIEFDLVNDTPPEVDMLMCLWVLNHLPERDAMKAFNNLRDSGSSFLLTTDRPRWHHDSPKEMIDAIYDRTIEVLVLNDKQDSIRLVGL